MTRENLKIANLLDLKIKKLEFYLNSLRDEHTQLLINRPGGLCISFYDFNEALDGNFNDKYQKEIIEKLKRYLIDEIDRLSIELYNL